MDNKIWKMVEFHKEQIITRKWHEEITFKNNGTDDRYDTENDTYIHEELAKISMNLRMNDLLLLLQNQEIAEPVKLKAIETYNRNYGKSIYVSDIWHGLSIDDF